MKSLSQETCRPGAILWAFVTCHLVVWTLTPSLSQPNGPLDVIELLNWGSHWQWGYEKHPPLPAWIAEAFAQVAGKSVWGVYLASQIAVCACFWAVWRFARDSVSPAHALLSVLLLEAVYYYNYTSPEFRHDVLQLPIWALTVLFLWRSLNSGRIGYWLLCGVMVGLGLLTKYNMMFLLVTWSVFMLVNSQARQHLAKPGPYVALSVAALIFAPHLLWLVDNGFPTITYALARAEGRGRLIDHLVYPVEFALSQVLALVPLFILVGLLIPRSTWNQGEATPRGFSRAFLFTAAFGPFLVYLFASALIGFRLRSMWGTPLWSFIGVFIFFSVRPALTQKGLRRFTYAFFSFAALWVISFIGQFVVGPTLTGVVKRGHFPGQAIAAHVSTQWVKNYGRPLPIVGGDRWMAENIGFYSPDRPDVYTDLDPKKSPWTSDEDFERRGGVIIWSAVTDGNALPDPWRRRFPSAVVQPAASFAPQTSAAVPPVRIGWAIVAPASTLHPLSGSRRE